MNNINTTRKKLEILVSEINSDQSCDFKDAKIVEINGTQKSYTTIVVRDVIFNNEYKLLSKNEQKLYLTLSLKHAHEISKIMIRKLKIAHKKQEDPGQMVSVLAFLKDEADKKNSF